MHHSTRKNSAIPQALLSFLVLAIIHVVRLTRIMSVEPASIPSNVKVWLRVTADNRSTNPIPVSPAEFSFWNSYNRNVTNIYSICSYLSQKSLPSVIPNWILYGANRVNVEHSVRWQEFSNHARMTKPDVLYRRLHGKARRKCCLFFGG